MSALPHSPVYCADAVFPLSVDAYHDLIESGRLGEDDPVELIEGVLVFKMPKNTKHTVTSSRLIKQVVPTLSVGWSAQFQDPITLTDGEPEPDLSVVTAGSADRLAGHPGSGEIALVVEIADSSPLRDRGSKLRSYARAGIPTYWIINLNARVIEVYTSPLPGAEPPTYADRRDVPETQTIALPDVLGSATIASPTCCRPPDSLPRQGFKLNVRLIVPASRLRTAAEKCRRLIAA